MQNGPPDTTLLWCLERLATERLSCGTILAVLRDIARNRGELFFNDSLRARIMLASLASMQEITSDTISELGNLDQIVANTSEPELALIAPALRVPPELLLQVKTELVAQLWRNNMASPSDLIVRIHELVGNQSPAQEPERTRYTELLAAVSNPGHRMAIDRQSDTRNVLSGLSRFVTQCQNMLGPTLLEIINADINQGRYIPGQQPMLPPPSHGYTQTYGAQGHAGDAGQGFRPPPGIFGRAGNDRGYESPMQLVSRRNPVASPGKDFPEIREAVYKLHAAGGKDPIANAEVIANLVAATADRLRSEIGAPLSPPMEGLTPGSAGLGPRPTLPRLPGSAPPSHLRPSSAARAASMPRSASRFRDNRDRRVNRRWSEEETRALLDGCRKYGPGAWSAIHSEYEYLFGRPNGDPNEPFFRSQVDLKDKWRNLKKQEGGEAAEIEAEHRQMMTEQRNHERLAELARHAEEMENEDGEEDEAEPHGEQEEQEEEEERGEPATGNGQQAGGRRVSGVHKEGAEGEEEDEIYQSAEESEKEGGVVAVEEQQPAATEEQGEEEARPEDGGDLEEEEEGEQEEEEEEEEQEGIEIEGAGDGENEENGAPVRKRGRPKGSTKQAGKSKRTKRR